MKARKVTALAAILLAYQFGCAMTEMPKLQSMPLPGAVPEVEELRLAPAKTGVVAVVAHTASTPPVGARTDFFAKAVEGGAQEWRSLHSLSEIVPASPKWDIAAGTEGSRQLVYERAGGAVDSIWVQALGSAAAAKSISSAYPLQSFTKPRFARQVQGAPDTVTAILDERHCVAFPFTKSAEYVELADCSSGLLVRSGTGFMFLFKTDVPGAVRGGWIMPGRLHFSRLDGGLQRVGPAVDVADETIFDFDAVPVGDAVIVVATSARGLLVVVLNARGGAVKPEVQEHAAPLTLGQLSVAADDGGGVVLGVLDSTEDSAKRIWTTRFAIR